MAVLKKILSYPITLIFYFFYALTLFIFQPVQWLSLKLGGYQAHKKSVDYLSYCMLYSLSFLGTRIKYINHHEIPDNLPLIIVSNHQSLHDISGIGWFLRKYHPKFVSKKELGKGIPSISFNLNHGGSVLINRKNPKQALSALMKFGKYIDENKFAAVIFPEGMRSRNGVPKVFSNNGLKMMVKYAPDSYVVPITINNSWKLVRYGNFPMDLGVKLIFEVHEPIRSNSMPFEELFKMTEKVIKDSVIV